MIAIRIGTMRAMPKAGLKPGPNLSNLLAGPPPYNGKGGPSKAKLSAKAIGGIIINCENHYDKHLFSSV